MNQFYIENKKWIILFLLFFLFEIICGFFYLKYKKSKKTSLYKPEQQQEQQPQSLSNTDVSSQESINILLLGRGGEGHDGGTLTDSINLVSLNPKTKTANIIFIPRDLWVLLPSDWDNEQYGKINSALSIGYDDVRYPNKKPEFRSESGMANVSIEAAKRVTGLVSDYYILIDFNNFVKSVDLLGGIDVQVDKTFDDFFYPVKGLENETCGFSPQTISTYHQKYSGFELEKQFTCRYEHLHFDQGIQNMNGASTLKFVRSRHSQEDGGDFARGSRQIRVIEGIVKKIVTLNILSEGNKVLKNLFDMISTNLKINSIGKILSSLGNINAYEVNKIYFTEENYLTSSKSNNGQYILIPKAGNGNYEEIKKYISGSLK